MRQAETIQFNARDDTGLLALTGSRLAGRYDIGERLACGSYAEIFAARARATGATVIVKALNPALQGVCEAGLEETLIENLKSEAVALKRLRHPHIVELKDAGAARDGAGRDFYYLVLEYLPGGTLAALARQAGGLPLAQVLRIVEQLCAGLSHAHAHGVLHRDVKPENVLLAADGQTVKLADFGIARLDRWHGLVTQVGSGCYAAPEHFTQAATTKRLTPAADVYALAKTVYFLCTGEAPRRYAQHPLLAWPAKVAGAEAVLRVLTRATATDPAARPASVAEFWDELLAAAQSAESTRVRPHRSRFVVDWLEPEAVEAEPPEAAVRDSHFYVEAAERWRTLLKLAAWRDGRLALVWCLSLLLCGGVALATYSIVRETRQRIAPVAPPISMVGRVGVLATDVNLRPTDGTKHQPIGLAERAARVRVLAVHGDWYLIKVVRRVRPKEKPQSADQGWVRGKYVIFAEAQKKPEKE